MDKTQDFCECGHSRADHLDFIVILPTFETDWQPDGHGQCKERVQDQCAQFTWTPA